MLTKTLALASAAVTAALLFVSSAVAANISPSVWVKSCPNTACSNQTLLPRGTGVVMLCWGDYQYALGNYWSARWFVVYYGYGSGWVHSSYVYNQTSVGHCR